MKDKTKLGLVITSVCLGVVVLIGLIYFIIAKKRYVSKHLLVFEKFDSMQCYLMIYFYRADNHFYRTYVSTDENRHLTKGNDGFEPLDDSDIDWLKLKYGFLNTRWAITWQFWILIWDYDTIKWCVLLSIAAFIFCLVSIFVANSCIIIAQCFRNLYLTFK